MLAAACMTVVPLAAQAPAAAPATTVFDAAAAARFADLALACVHQEYPNKIAHVMQSDADVKPPRELTPAFFGCYDWHSSVHGHWLLARLARLFPDAPFAPRARAALARSLDGRATPPPRSRYLAGPGPHQLRAALRPGVAAAAGGRTAGVGGPAGAAVGRRPAPARDRGRRAPEGVAAEALAPDPDRRARSDGLRLRPRARLGAHGRRPRR